MKIDARRLFTLLLGLPVGVGLIGTLIGLGRSSFWYDELFTAWVVKSDRQPSHVFSRILTDLHPPVYYFSVYLYSLIVGTSDAALRSYSALAVCAAALIIVFGTRPVLSRNARLIAAGLMLGSKYAFYMAQNARSYALCLLFGAGMLALAVMIRTDERRRWLKTGALFAVAVLGAFTHYFMTFEAVALCLVLALYLPAQRIALIAFSVILVSLNALYVRDVVNVFAQFSPNHTWMDNDFDTYVSDIGDTMSFLGFKAVAVFGICLTIFLLDVYAERLKPLAITEGFEVGLRSMFKSFVRWIRGFDSFAAMCLCVPILVFVFSVVSSFLRPNFNPQNFLLVGPFIWCGCARLYDIAMARTQPYVRQAANGVIVVLILGMSMIVAGRFVERNEPWKESAADVRTFAACRGQVIPVVSEDGPYLRNPKFPDRYAPFLYGYYLGGFAPTRIFELTDIDKGQLPPDIRAIIADRLKGGGCPIVAWSAHTPPDHYADKLMPELKKTVGKPAPGYHLEKREYDYYDQVWSGDTASNPGFIVTVEPGPAPPKDDDDDDN
jgi:hypothetical protein